MHQVDQHLRASINEELKHDPSVQAQRVVVTVSNGTVRLSGEVSSLSEKFAANRSAMRVRGVIAVTNQIALKQPESAAAGVTSVGQRDR
jgi:osmotically-inducible protein OsmY